MFQDSKVLKSVMLLMMTGLLGAAGCATEAADEQVEDAAAEMPAGMEGEAPAGMGEMSAPHGQVSVVMYTCADDKGFALTLAPGVGQAALRVEDGVFQLTQQEVASGMEFSDGTYTFRGKGPEATVEMNGEPVYVDCTAAGHPVAPVEE